MRHNRNDSNLFENQTRQVLFMVPFPEGFTLGIQMQIVKTNCKLERCINSKKAAVQVLRKSI